MNRLLAMTAVVLAVAAGSSPAAGPEFSWVPVAATSPDGGSVLGYTGSGANCPDEPTHIQLLAGYEYVVEFELRMSGWAAATETPTLSTYQVAVDSTGYGDLYPYFGPHGLLDGKFTGLKKCHEYADGGYVACRDYCEVWGPGDPSCPGEANPGCDSCLENPRFVFGYILSTNGPGTWDPNYAWGATVDAWRCKADDGCPSWYGGTLKLVAPDTARGTYMFGFDPNPGTTFMNNCGGYPIEGLVLTEGGVALTGACCMPEGSCELQSEDEC